MQALRSHPIVRANRAGRWRSVRRLEQGYGPRARRPEPYAPLCEQQRNSDLTHPRGRLRLLVIRGIEFVETYKRDNSRPSSGSCSKRQRNERPRWWSGWTSKGKASRSGSKTRSKLRLLNRLSFMRQRRLSRPQSINLLDDQIVERLSKADWAFTTAYTRFLTHDLHPYPAKFPPHIPRLAHIGSFVARRFGLRSLRR